MLENLFNLYGLLNIYALIFAPFIFGLMVYFGLFGKNSIVIRRISKWFSGLHCLYALLFVVFYNLNFQYAYADELNIFGKQFEVFGQDILGSIFCAVFSVVIFISLIVAKSAILNKHKLFYAFAFFLESAFMASICAQNLNVFIFALIFEIFCAYILAANFTHSRLNKYLNTFVILNFIGILVFATFVNYFEITTLGEILDKVLTKNARNSMFLGVFLICAPNISLLPFHKPLCEIVQNSSAATFFVPLGQMLLGFTFLLKFCVANLGETFEAFCPFITLLATLNICYFGVLAISQVDIKKSFAYFCLSQAGIPVVALCSLNQNGLNGAIYETISRTFIFLALFLCLCFVVKKFKTSKLPLISGLLTTAPKLTFYSFAFILIAIGIPLTSGFCAKFLCVLGGFSIENNYSELIWTGTIFTTLGIILGGLYLVKVFQQAFFGPPILTKNSDILRHQGTSLFLLLIICVIALGIFAQAPLDLISTYTNMIISAP